MKKHTIAVAGIGYVGLSNAVLLAQHNRVIAVDLSKERVDMLNARECPIVDTEMEEYLATKELDLSATTDGSAAYAEADYIIVATPTNYDPDTNFFDTSSIEAVIDTVTGINPDATIIIKIDIRSGGNVGKALAFGIREATVAFFSAQ